MLLISMNIMDILIINSLMVFNSVMVNCELYRRNYDFEQFSLQYHWTAVDAVVRQLPIASVALLLWSVITETISVTAWLSWLLCVC